MLEISKLQVVSRLQAPLTLNITQIHSCIVISFPLKQLHKCFLVERGEGAMVKPFDMETCLQGATNR